MLEQASQLGTIPLQSSLDRLMAEVLLEAKNRLDAPAKQLADGLNIWLGNEEQYVERVKKEFSVSGVPDDATPQKILGHALDKRYVRGAVTDHYNLGIIDGFFYHSKRDKEMRFEIVAIPRKKTDRPIKTE